MYSGEECAFDFWGIKNPFKVSVSLLSFGLVDLPRDDKAVLKSPTTTVLLYLLLSL